MTRPISRCSRFAAALALAAAAAGAHAQGTFPTKPVRFVVTFTTGGAADVSARIVAERLSALWKQQVVVENRTGAGGNIGLEAVQKAAPDGYTLVILSNSHAVNVGLFEKLPFDLTRDFVPVANLVSTPFVLVGNPKVPESNFRDLMGSIQKSPGKLTYASCGNGTTHHVAMESIKAQTRSFIVHVPYRGCSPATTDVVGGQVDLAMVTLAPALPHIKSGRLKAYAITDAKRSVAAPDIPTIRESGVPALRNYELVGWYALAAPAGTPPDVIAKIEADARTVLAQPDVQKRLLESGLEAAFAPGAEVARWVRDDIANFRKTIEYARMKAD
jgi:tripartite-type tricarboxylate transporter receptor subunit TctC